MVLTCWAIAQAFKSASESSASIHQQFVVTGNVVASSDFVLDTGVSRTESKQSAISGALTGSLPPWLSSDAPLDLKSHVTAESGSDGSDHLGSDEREDVHKNLPRPNSDHKSNGNVLNFAHFAPLDIVLAQQIVINTEREFLSSESGSALPQSSVGLWFKPADRQDSAARQKHKYSNTILLEIYYMLQRSMCVHFCAGMSSAYLTRHFLPTL